MKKVNIDLRPNIIHLNYGSEFATMTRRANENNQHMIIFSTPITATDADVINNSGIAEVKEISFDNQTIMFSRCSFYETHLMSELIVDILKRHEEN